MWVRGLKHTSSIMGNAQSPVAPYVGAWIETAFDVSFDDA